MSCTLIAAVGLHLASWHSNPVYNNANPGLYARSSCGLIADTDRLADGVQLGSYYNSERRQTFYAAYVVDVQPINDVHWLGVFASIGAATGYAAHDMIPLALAGLKLNAGRASLRLGYAPKFGKINDTHLVHAAVEWSF
jgi:hypothetical protein